MRTPLVLSALLAMSTAFAADPNPKRAPAGSRAPTGSQAPAVAPSSSALASGTIKSKVVDPVTNSVTETISDSKGRIIKKTVFYFDVNNWTTGAVHYDKEGNIKYKESYKRNSAGQMTDSYLYSPTDQLLGRRTLTYNARGETSQIDDYDAAGKLISRALPKAASAQKR